MPRPALLASVTIQKSADGLGDFTVDAFNLGDSTSLEPNPQQQGTALGVERRAVRGFTVKVTSLVEANFTTLDGWQQTGELLDVTFNYADGSTSTALRVGFTVTEDEAAELGTLVGWTLDGTAFATTLPGVLALTPALPVAP